MENTSVVRNGGMKLPVGYRFCPTDEELIVYYLNRKAHSLPLPAQVIPELNVFQTNPWDLPGDLREKRFFFWRREGKWRKNKGRTEYGYWKGMRKEKHVLGFESNRLIGLKKTFVFYEGKQGHGLRTRWVMKEYCLLGSQSIPNTSAHQKFVREMEEEWVVFKIYQKKTKPNKNAVNAIKSDATVGQIRPTVMEMMSIDINDSGPPQPSSSCSSGFSCAENEEEIVSANNIVSFYS